MLSNAYFLAKFRFDTAENEPAKILQNFVVSLGLKRKLTLGLSARWRRIKSELIQNGGNFGTEHWITEMRGHSCLFDPGVGGGPGHELRRARPEHLLRCRFSRVHIFLRALAESYTIHTFLQISDIRFSNRNCQTFRNLFEIVGLAEKTQYLVHKMNFPYRKQHFVLEKRIFTTV